MGSHPHIVQIGTSLCKKQKSRESAVANSSKRPLSFVAPSTDARDLTSAAAVALPYEVERVPDEASAINQIIREGHFEADLVQKQVSAFPQRTT